MIIIRKIKDLCDYMYYRIYKFYYKWDKETGITVLIAVSLFQTILLADLILIMLKSIFSKWEIVPFSEHLKWGFAGLYLTFVLLNFKYFSNKYENFNSIWGKEDSKIKKRRGWLIVLVLLIPWLIIIYLGILNRR